MAVGRLKLQFMSFEVDVLEQGLSLPCVLACLVPAPLNKRGSKTESDPLKVME